MSPPPASKPRQGWFPETRWSLVLAANGSDESARAALEALCRAYWHPVYAFIRARGFQRAEAEDLAQGFFTRIVQGDVLPRTHPDRGRLRSFLAVAIRNFISHEVQRDAAQRRGGHLFRSEEDVNDSEALLVADRDLPPDRMFDRHWALAQLNRVVDRLSEEYHRMGKADQFAAFRQTVALGNDSGTGRDIARSLGMSEGAARVALHRFRNRYRDLLIDEIAHTVDGPEAVEPELRALMTAV